MLRWVLETCDVRKLSKMRVKVRHGVPLLNLGAHLQLERTGYYCVDTDSSADRVVLNRTATLRDTWAKTAKKSAGNPPKAKNPNKKNKKKKKDSE